MKKIKLLLFLVIGLLIIPSSVFAASGSIKVTGTSTAVLGNKVTVTVTLSSSTKIGSWQMDLNYDKSYLKLVSASSEAGGTIMASSSSSGTKSKSYTFTFKTLKKGSTKVSVSSYLAYAFEDMDEIDLSSTSKTIKILTQEELEATYSSNADLKSLSVDGYEITPKFSSSVLEYSLEVENNVESVKVNAKEDDSKSEIEGTGTIQLLEGNNKIEIVVTAQKGNRKTYVLNIYRKELDPINVNIKGIDYTIVRKSDSIPILNGFELTEVDYEEYKVPALKSEITSKILLALKDTEGNVYTYIYENNLITQEYYEIKSNQVTIYPLDLKETGFENYIIKKIKYNNYEIEGYVIKDNSNFVIIYGENTDNGEKNYYQLNLLDNTISRYSNDIDEYYQDMLTKYKYVIYGLVGFSVFLIFLLIIRKPKNKKCKNINQANLKVEDVKEEVSVTEIKTISSHDQKKLEKEQKKILKEERKKQKVRKDFDF